MSDSRPARVPRKVLHVMNAAVGGAALSTLALMRALKARGIASCAVCHDAGSEEERAAVAEATHGEVIFTPLYWWNRKIRVPTWKRPLSQSKQWLRTGFHRVSAAKVAWHYRQWGADLIHSNTLTTLEGAVVSRWLNVPHVWHVREMVGPGNPFVFPLEGDALARFLSHHADVVVANSEASAAALRSPLLEEQLRVISNGLELDAFLKLSPRASSSPVVVAMVGNLTSAWKKHPLFLDAAAKVKTRTPVEFRLYGVAPEAGADAYTDSLRAQASQCGAKLMGFADAVSIMNDIDILAHAADAESFGRVAVEAMAAARPVVGVKAGGIGEVVEHGKTGLLGPVDDPVAMAAHLTQLIENEAERHRLGEAGRVRAQTQYSIDACADAVVNAYSAAMFRRAQMSSQLRLIVEWAWGRWTG